MEIVLLPQAEADRDYWKKTGNKSVMKRMEHREGHGDGLEALARHPQQEDRGGDSERRARVGDG